MLAFSKEFCETMMANISIRKLEDHIYHQLRIRAAKHGVSMEEEVRQIICHAVSTSSRVSEVFRKYFGPEHGVNLDLSHERPPHEPMDFQE